MADKKPPAGRAATINAAAQSALGQPSATDDVAAAFQKAMAESRNQVTGDDPLVYTGGVWDSDAYGRRWLEVRGRSDPLSKVQGYFYMLEPDELRRFQEDAFAAGFYGSADKEDIPFGDFDEDTFKIWSTLAQRSSNFLTAGTRKTVWDVLADAKRNAPTKTVAGKERQPLVIRLSNPDDLRAIIGKMATQVTGGVASLDPEQAEAFVNEVHEAERAAQRQFYQASGSGLPGGPGGEVTEVGDAAEKARKALYTQKPKEATQASYIEDFNTFMGLLGR